jgi:hypothetical protein
MLMKWYQNKVNIAVWLMIQVNRAKNILGENFTHTL